MSDYPEMGQPEYEEEFDLAKQAAWDLEQEHLRELEAEEYTAYWNEFIEEPEPFDPATEVVDIINSETVITLDGMVKQIETRIYADGHTEDHQYFLEDTCEEPWWKDIPY